MIVSGFDWILAGIIVGLIIAAIGAHTTLLWYVLS